MLDKDQKTLIAKMTQSANDERPTQRTNVVLEGASALYDMYSRGVTNEQLQMSCGGPSNIRSVSRITEGDETHYEVRFATNEGLQVKKIKPGVIETPTQVLAEAASTPTNIKIDKHGIASISRTAGGYMIESSFEGVAPEMFSDYSDFIMRFARMNECSITEAESVTAQLDDAHYSDIGGASFQVQEAINLIAEGAILESRANLSGSISVRIKPGVPTKSANKLFEQLNSALIQRGWKARMVESLSWSCQRLINESDARKRAFKAGIPYPDSYYMAQSTDAIMTPKVGGEMGKDGNRKPENHTGSVVVTKDDKPSILDLMLKKNEPMAEGKGEEKVKDPFGDLMAKVHRNDKNEIEIPAKDVPKGYNLRDAEYFDAAGNVRVMSDEEWQEMAPLVGRNKSVDDTVVESDARKRAYKAGIPAPDEHYKAQSTDAILQPKVDEENENVDEAVKLNLVTDEDDEFHKALSVVSEGSDSPETPATSDPTKSADDALFNPLKLKMQRELLKYAIQSSRDFMCPYTGEMLDIRRSVLVTFQKNGKDVKSYIMDGAHWDHKKAEMEKMAKDQGGEFEVIDGRILNGGRKPKGPGGSKKKQVKIDEGVVTVNGIPVPAGTYFIEGNDDKNAILVSEGSPRTYVVSCESIAGDNKATILSIYDQLRSETPGGYDIHAQTKQDFERGSASAPLTEEPFRTRREAIEFGVKEIKRGAYEELWYEKATPAKSGKSGKRSLIQVNVDKPTTECLDEALLGLSNSDTIKSVDFSEETIFAYSEGCEAVISTKMDEQGEPYVVEASIIVGGKVFYDLDLESFARPASNGAHLAEMIVDAMVEATKMHGAKRTWSSEFPGFKAMPPEILSLAKEGKIEDISWHNDMSPSYQFGPKVDVDDFLKYRLFVDNEEPKDREEPDMGKRFTIQEWDGSNHGNTVMESDDAAEIVAKIRALLEKKSIVSEAREKDTKVIFRKFKDDDDVLAIFPDIKADNSGNVSSFMHVGQHGAASMKVMKSDTVPATPEEYAELKKELESPPYEYKLKVVELNEAKAENVLGEGIDRAKYEAWQKRSLEEFNDKYGATYGKRKYYETGDDRDPDDVVELGEDGTAYPHSKAWGTNSIKKAVKPYEE